MPPPTHPASLGLLLRLLHQRWTQAVEAALEQAGFGDVRPSHANVFTFMRPEGVQVSELTRLAHVRKQTMAQAVEELERGGYVERRPDPADRRPAARTAQVVESGGRAQRGRRCRVSLGSRRRRPRAIFVWIGHGEDP